MIYKYGINILSYIEYSINVGLTFQLLHIFVFLLLIIIYLPSSQGGQTVNLKWAHIILFLFILFLYLFFYCASCKWATNSFRLNQELRAKTCRLLADESYKCQVSTICLSPSLSHIHKQSKLLAMHPAFNQRMRHFLLQLIAIWFNFIMLLPNLWLWFLYSRTAKSESKW